MRLRGVAISLPDGWYKRGRGRGLVDCRSHWKALFDVKASTEVSWYQSHLRLSLRLITRAGVPPDAKIIDVGGGDSSLVDDLLKRGFSAITVLDIASSAIKRAKERLGPAGSAVHWMETDIVNARLPRAYFDVWHDRAVFHFLIDENLRRKYRQQAAHALKANGHLILATFAADGPDRCSGLPTMRYSKEAIIQAFEQEFLFVECRYERHMTPKGAEQRFIYCRFRRK
jgi:SAM-dependent methyltransferase